MTSTTPPKSPTQSPSPFQETTTNKPPLSPSPSLVLPSLSVPSNRTLVCHSSAPPLQVIRDINATTKPLRSSHQSSNHGSGSNDTSLRADIQASVRNCGETHVHTARLYLQLGNIEFRRGRYTAAAVAYDQARKCPAEQAVAELNAASVCWRQGRVRDAIQLLQASIAVPRVAASACYQMGLCFALLRESDTAVYWLSQAAQQQEDPVAVARTLDFMGQVRFRDERYTEAVRLHLKALRLLLDVGSVSTTRTLEHLLRAYAALGQSDTAMLTVVQLWKLQKQACAPWVEETKNILDNLPLQRMVRTARSA